MSVNSLRLIERRDTDTFKTYKKVYPKRCALCTYSVGGPLGNYHFVWRLPEEVTLEDSLQEIRKIIEQIKENAPKYHSRALRKHLITQFGRISHSCNLALLREFYRQATGDQSSSLTTAEEEMDDFNISCVYL